LSKPDGPEVSVVLARKAKNDRDAMLRLASDPAIDDDLVGFHAQQAIEKWLKAVLGSRGIEFPTRHDLGRLLEMVAEADIEQPPKANELDALTVYAVEARYVDPFGVPPLERDRVAELVDGVGAWAERLLAPAEE
jgi:HEPN domain-containing protein